MRASEWFWSSELAFAVHLHFICSLVNVYNFERSLIAFLGLSLSPCACHHSVFFFSLFFLLFHYLISDCPLCVFEPYTKSKVIFSRTLKSSLSQRITTICDSFHSIFVAVAHAWYWCHLVVPFAPIFRSTELSLSWIAFKCKVNHLKMHQRWNRRSEWNKAIRLCELKNDNLIAEIYIDLKSKSHFVCCLCVADTHRQCEKNVILMIVSRQWHSHLEIYASLFFLLSLEW